MGNLSGFGVYSTIAAGGMTLAAVSSGCQVYSTTASGGL